MMKCVITSNKKNKENGLCKQSISIVDLLENDLTVKTSVIYWHVEQLHMISQYGAWHRKNDRVGNTSQWGLLLQLPKSKVNLTQVGLYIMDSTKVTIIK